MEKFITSLKPYTKAIVAFIVGCLHIASLVVFLNNDGSFSNADIQAIINAVILNLAGTGAVYQLPNKKV